MLICFLLTSTGDDLTQSQFSPCQSLTPSHLPFLPYSRTGALNRLFSNRCQACTHCWYDIIIMHFVQVLHYTRSSTVAVSVTKRQQDNWEMIERYSGYTEAAIKAPRPPWAVAFAQKHTIKIELFGSLTFPAHYKSSTQITSLTLLTPYTSITSLFIQSSTKTAGGQTLYCAPTVFRANQQ